MSSVNYQVVAYHLTRYRLASDLHATGGSLGSALDLHDWNTRAGAALDEDLRPRGARVRDRPAHPSAVPGLSAPTGGRIALEVLPP